VNDRVLASRKRRGLLSLPTNPDALLVGATNEWQGLSVPGRAGSRDGSVAHVAHAGYGGEDRELLVLSEGEFGRVRRRGGAIVLIVTDSRHERSRYVPSPTAGARAGLVCSPPRQRGLVVENVATETVPYALYGPFWGRHGRQLTSMGIADSRPAAAFMGVRP